MRVMMLHRPHRLPQLLRQRRRLIARVEVAGHRARRNLQKRRQTINGFAQRRQRAKIGKIAHISRRIEKIVLSKAKGIFQLAPQSQHFAAQPGGKHHRKRRVAPAAAHHIRSALRPVHHRIIGAHPNAPVVRQNLIGKWEKRGAGLAVRPTDGRASGISARHNEDVRHIDSIGIIKQQQMKRRIGKHEADPPQPRRSAVYNAALRTLF